ncbi:hypothetical protein LUZ60_015417 [Juncus effusus]|nr:hypothetical protein LUZ60_015417 [Juncus effusus]
MGSKEGFVLFLLLVFSWTVANARLIIKTDIIVAEYITEGSQDETNKLERKEDVVCTVCENFTTQAIEYIKQNETQEEIVQHLHKACSQIKSFEQQCNLLVDYYARLFFTEIYNINPKDFCKEVDLCESSVSYYSTLLKPKQNSTCVFCHHLVDEVLEKLKDPDSEFEILEMLLKECSKVQGHVQECKKIVLQYTPLILMNGEKFLEKNDICTAIKACPVNKEPSIKSVSMETSSLDE